MRPRTQCAKPLLALAALTAGVGALWAAVNLREVPHYGDTLEYLRLSKTLRVDEYRGYAYPLLLAGIAPEAGDAALEESFQWEPRVKHPELDCAAPSVLTRVQVLQTIACAFGLGYFLSVLLGWRWGTRPTRGQLLVGALLWGLLLFDPLISHFNLAIMPDSLALTGSLVFVAALSHWMSQRSSPLLAGTLLFVSTVLASGLRPEKVWVLSATAACSLTCWWLRRTRGPGATSVPWKGRRALLALALVGLGAVVSLTTQKLLYADHGRWPSLTMIVHQRLVFPHLQEIYPHLSPETRERFELGQVQRYDRRIQGARQVVSKVVGDDAGLRDRLTEEMGRVALQQRAGALALDVVTDAGENLFATASFYARLLVWWRGGVMRYEPLFIRDGTRWTYQRMMLHWPLLSFLYVGLALALAVLALPLALLRAPGAWRSMRRRGFTCSAWTPLLFLCLLNALAFAATANLVHIRYAIHAHVAGLVLLYAGAFGWLGADRGPPHHPESSATPPQSSWT